ncbi:alpha carbonic anhydrase 4-like [Andrographis paniculata]|uniref:alpha carbonic anhydrase 4-like n=1 Tax=Andrographis paniculata TaxID=175694 RepID=UPI0021E95DFC|nr:alpha carbonic anhydrase 4-like [Andrographis paniculata]
MATFRLCLNLLLASLLLHQLLSTVAHTNEVENQHDFTYSVNMTTGPHNWGKLNPNWTACGIGQFQSPIDLVDSRVVVLPALGSVIRLHKPAPAQVQNRGHDITVKWVGDAGGVIINGTMYKLQQCHWHTPSEHTVEGRKYPMEMHMVHQDSRGQIAVIGLLYNVGTQDPFLASLLRNNRNISHIGQHMGVVDPNQIRFESRHYLRYIGSLTTPPCTEGVIWTILRQRSTVSVRQIKGLRRAVEDGFENNARPIQHYTKPVFINRPDREP